MLETADCFDDVMVLEVNELGTMNDEAEED